MADDWDLSDEDLSTKNTAKPQAAKKKKKRKRNRKKKGKQSESQAQSQSNSEAQSAKQSPSKNKSKNKNKKKKADTWSDSDDDKELKPKSKAHKQPASLKDASLNKPKKQKKQKKRNKNLDDDSNDETEERTVDGDESTDKKVKGIYPIWRPEQNYKYNGLQYTKWPDYIQRDEILLKVKRKQTFVDVLRAFERTHGMNKKPLNTLDVELLEIYGLNIWNEFQPIYELICEDNHRPFMIEFDSLMLDIFHSPLIENNLKFGARIAAIIDLLDNHLDLLFAGGRSVQIIVFENHCNLWKYPVHYFMREFAKYYLKTFWQKKQQTKYDISYALMFEFESFWSLDFAKYIYENLPVLACIARPDLSPFISDDNRYLFIYLAFYITSLGTPCVQSTELSFASNALYGFTIDIPTKIKLHLLDRFIKNKKAGSTQPVQLQPLLPPKPPQYIANMPSFNADLFTNLNFIEFIANDEADENKRNLRRLATIYALISMFRDKTDVDEQLKWDFIKLILLNTVILEHEPNEYRAQMMPKLVENEKKEATKVTAKAKKEPVPQSSWLDLDDSVSDDPDEEPPDDEEEEEEEEVIEEEVKEEEKKAADDDDGYEEEYDLERVINECWWIQLEEFGDLLNKFMMHCSVLLAQYDDNDCFGCNSFSDCFDFRILFYLLTKSAQLKSDKTLLTLIKTENELNKFSKLFAIVQDEVSGSDELFPLLQSKLLLNNAKFSDIEYYDYNQNIAISDSVSAQNSFIRVSGDMMDSLCGEIERTLSDNKLLYSTKNASGSKERNEFFRKYSWIRGGSIPDGINPYEYNHRNYMIFQTFIAKYAQSLEGGKVVLRDVIVAKKKGNKKNDDKKNKNKKKKGHKGQKKYVHKSSKPMIDVRIQAELEVRRRERLLKQERITNLIRLCENHYASLEQKILRLDEELMKMDDGAAADTLPGLRQLHEWATLSALECNPERNIYPVVRLWQITFDIFRRFIEGASDDECIISIEFIHKLQASLHLLGFFSCGERIARVYCQRMNGKYRFDECQISNKNTTDDIRISIGCSYHRFMLLYCGPFMIRGVGSRPDSRVSGFYPDEWQIKLLDIVDSNESALVVAPTSCGKTFVSYYCMKEILQQNKSIKSQSAKGIVVYVSPTKALTWQACADIYSKYGDVFGVLTPDYDHKPLECQVLVCVPESFEKLLMSKQRQQLSEQIKYVIFDEIHCLGRSEGGAIWERLLMLIESPFLALSATVGAPENLCKWLNILKKTNKRKVSLIQHHERWSYLEKYIYLPTADTEVSSNKLDDDNLFIGSYRDIAGWKTAIHKLHPVGSIGLTTGENSCNILDVYGGFPPFLKFSPSDSCSFYDAMYKFVDLLPSEHGYKESLAALKADTYFADRIYITKNDATAYENALKLELNAWLNGRKEEECVDKTLRRQIVNKLLNSMASDTLSRIDRMELIHGQSNCYSFNWVRDNFIHLVVELSSTDRLPALVFVLDRVECEEIYLKLLHDLEYLEKRKQEREQSELFGASSTSASAKEKLRQLEIERRRRAKKLERERKKREKLRETQARQKKDDDSRSGDKKDGDALAAFEDDSFSAKDYRFCLFSRGDEMDSDEISFWIRRLIKKTRWPSTHPLLLGLERGIGLHHEGLPLQYRHLVETLFRARHIKLVVSQASLAMGVNMPARSVIFAGDNCKLDPLNYRQMMGRAGRRGYDNIGHVLFFGISPRKISYLMTSQLTSLNGHYPILSTSSSLRIVENEPLSFRNLFNIPFNCNLSKQIVMNNEFYVRYCIEYHSQNGLFASNGSIDGLASLAAVLYEYEPNNLLFTHILQCGYLHKLCGGYHKLPGDATSKLKRDILSKLMLILCYIFQLHPHPISFKPKSATNYFSKSNLTLPTHKLSREILSVCDKFRHNFVSHYYNMYYLHNKHKNTINARNYYGKENTINYIKYYLKYCAGGIFGHNQIFTQDFRGRNMHHNSYIYDFYLHEDYKRIVAEASLRDGLAWRKLKKFQLLLSMIQKSLTHISSLKSAQNVIDVDVKNKIEEFEAGLEKLRQHKYSIYRRQQQFWKDRKTNKLWKKSEIEAHKNKLRLQAIGDDFVMCFQDLAKDFRHKFRNIVPIGPISNYSQVILQQQQAAAAAMGADEQQQAAANASK